MKIDLHVHSRASDGKMSVEKIFQEAARRKIDVISITDHDSLDSQEAAKQCADAYGIGYLTGIELNVTYAHPGYKNGKSISLDFLGYQYDIYDKPLREKLLKLREYREKRAEKILQNLNLEFQKSHLPAFARADLQAIQDSVDGSLGRPHIADYLIRKGIVKDRKEAFDKFLVKCNVPKMPLSLAEASSLIRKAGGKLFFAHPANPRGTSLVSLGASIEEQQRIIEEDMLPHLDGIECWHSSYDRQTSDAYLKFAKKLGLWKSGGSDCHQQPVLMGSVDVPACVAKQFGFYPKP